MRIDECDIYKNVNRDVLLEFREKLKLETENADKESQKRMESKILLKLENGKQLTNEEMQYLRRNNPALYIQAVRVQIKRRSLETQLKNAKTKQEVCRIQDMALASVDKNDVAKKYIIAAVKETVEEFKATDYYKSLPEVNENENKKSGKTVKFKSAYEEDKEYTVAYEMFDNMYQTISECAGRGFVTQG